MTGIKEFLLIDGNLLVINLLIQITFLALVALAVIQFFQRNAVLRYSILSSALVGICIVTAFSLLLQKNDFRMMGIPLTTTAAPWVTDGDSAKNSQSGPGSPLKQTLALNSDETLLSTQPQWLSGLTIVPLHYKALMVWLGGFLFAVYGFLRSLHKVERLRKESRCVPCDQLQRLRQSLDCSIKTDRSLNFRQSHRISSPMVVGIFNPVILLPSGMLNRFTTCELEVIMIHEIAHILRRDAIVNFAQKFIVAIFWFHPLIHMISAQIGRAREEICDNYVLSKASALDYGEALLHVSMMQSQLRNLMRSNVDERSLITALGILSGRWKLETRVTELLDEKRVLGVNVRRGMRSAIYTGVLCSSVLVASWQIHAVTATKIDMLQVSTLPPFTPEFDELPVLQKDPNFVLASSVRSTIKTPNSVAPVQLSSASKVENIDPVDSYVDDSHQLEVGDFPGNRQSDLEVKSTKVVLTEGEFVGKAPVKEKLNQKVKSSTALPGFSGTAEKSALVLSESELVSLEVIRSEVIPGYYPEKRQTKAMMKLDSKEYFAGNEIAAGFDDSLASDSSAQLEEDIVGLAIVNSAQDSFATVVKAKLLTNNRIIGLDSDSTSVDLNLVSSHKPHFPRANMARGREGTVLLDFTVTKNGNVENIVSINEDVHGNETRLKRGDDKFIEAAIKALEQFQYQPRIVAGMQVATNNVRFRFVFEITDSISNFSRSNQQEPERQAKNSTDKLTAYLGSLASFSELLSRAPVATNLVFQSEFMENTQLKLLKRVLPRYPATAQRRGLESVSFLEFSVTAEGVIENIEVLSRDEQSGSWGTVSDSHNSFDRAAMRALRNFEFQPEVVNGLPVTKDKVRYKFVFQMTS